jgi:hypothetical protein
MFTEKLCQGYVAPPNIKRQVERQRGNALFSALHSPRCFHVLWHVIGITKIKGDVVPVFN